MLQLTDFVRLLAKYAHAAGREVILHVPKASPFNLTPPGEMSALTSCRTFARLLARAIVDTPQIRGVNNLVGSEITQQDRHMSWFIGSIGCRGLYFVD